MRKVQGAEAKEKESEAAKEAEEEFGRLLQETLEELHREQVKLNAAGLSEPFKATEDASDEPGEVSDVGSFHQAGIH